MPTLAPTFTAQLAALKREPAVRAACLIGSAARRTDFTKTSDVDVLVVARDGETANARSTVRAMVPSRIGGHAVEAKIVESTALRAAASERTMFAAHVAREGRPVFDRSRDLKAVRKCFPPGARVAEDSHRLLNRLELYADLDWCHGHYLSLLADVYAFGRAGAMLALAREGIFEFGRLAPLDRFGSAHFGDAGAAATVRQLEPFYLRERRGIVIEPPFHHRDCHREAGDARDACRAILETCR